MKNYFYSILFASICCLSTHATALDKIYVCSKDIIIADNGIFVNHDENLLSIESVTKDEQGLYFLPEHSSKISSDIALWICKEGHYVHRVKKCPRCGDQQRD